MTAGTLLVVAALVLLLSNQQEEHQAETFSEEMLYQIQAQIDQLESEDVLQSYTDNIPAELLTDEEAAMTEKDINGQPCIGYIEIPELNLELPVISDWSLAKLKVAPCRFYGTARENNLVIMAHNYKSHFGRLSTLSIGSQVVLTDMDGSAWNYQVVAIDILEPTEVDEMISGEYDLTLFTCTPGGKQRVTVRCDQADS